MTPPETSTLAVAAGFSRTQVVGDPAISCPLELPPPMPCRLNTVTLGRLDDGHEPVIASGTPLISQDAVGAVIGELRDGESQFHRVGAHPNVERANGGGTTRVRHRYQIVAPSFRPQNLPTRVTVALDASGYCDDHFYVRATQSDAARVGRTLPPGEDLRMDYFRQAQSVDDSSEISAIRLLGLIGALEPRSHLVSVESCVDDSPVDIQVDVFPADQIKVDFSLPALPGDRLTDACAGQGVISRHLQIRIR